MYIKSVDGFQGDGSFMSKFGIEVRDRVTFSVAQRIFNEEVGNFASMIRPKEGDIIYFPLNGRCFQITYVNKFEMFYQLGALQTWEMQCELFEYSGETFNTGIPEIDKIQKVNDTNILHHTVKTEDGNYIVTEEGQYITLENSSLDDMDTLADNDEIQREGDQFIDWSVYDPFSEGNI